jgi:hypothetical protein
MANFFDLLGFSSDDIADSMPEDIVRVRRWPVHRLLLAPPLCSY